MTATVPPGPFVAWLNARINHVGAQAVRDRLAIGGEQFAALQERTTPLAIDTIDRYLTRWDGPDTLATLYPATEPAGRPDRGRSYVCDEQTLITAHTLHMDGMSVRGVARALFDECYSASPAALAMAFLSAWRARGWEVRTRREATVLANQQRGWRPQCQHEHQLGPRRGERCARRTIGNDEWCWHHDPARIAAGIARIRQDTAA